MIESIEFTNYKALRKTTLPLAPFTLLLGPNGSGKSSVLQALQGVASAAASRVGGLQRLQAVPEGLVWSTLLSVTSEDRSAAVEARFRLQLDTQAAVAAFQWRPNDGQIWMQIQDERGTLFPPDLEKPVLRWFGRMQTYSLDASAIAHPVPVNSGPGLYPNGLGLAAVLGGCWSSSATAAARPSGS
jgi:energy-coupling factor transporter ATP-binding protein EcfA2